jgi:hypothetical protein
VSISAVIAVAIAAAAATNVAASTPPANSALAASSSASADPATTEKLGVFDDSAANKPGGGIAFIGPGVRSGQVVTVELFIVFIAPSSTVPGFEGRDVSYLRASVRYDCVARTRRALTMSGVGPSGASTKMPVPGSARRTVTVPSDSHELSDTAFAYACGGSTVKATVVGIDAALAYARRVKEPPVEPPSPDAGDKRPRP